MSTFGRPAGLRAGFHATFEDDDESGLLHAGEQWAPPQFMITKHNHPVWEIYFQIHGSTVWDVASDCVDVRPGDMLAVPPYTWHRLVDCPGGTHHFFYAALDLALLGERLGVPAKLTNDGEAVLLRATPRAIPRSFEELMWELTMRLEHSAVGLRLAVERLSLEAFRTIGGSSAVSRVAGHAAVLRTRHLLDTQYERRWSLKSLAALEGLSPTYLESLFSGEVGMPVHRYLNERRVERAAHFLMVGELKIAAIAEAVGFSSGHHLARVFRSVTGCSPLEYRQTVQAAS